MLDVLPDLFEPDWPGVARLNSLTDLKHRYSTLPIRFAEQDAALLGDGKHYEERILEQGVVATRMQNWHDLFNALIWVRYSSLKSAVNSRYVAEFPNGTGCTERSRVQMALTHFDEAGVVVAVDSQVLIDAWNRHDWAGVFANPVAPWHKHARMLAFGHALYEHCLSPHQLLVGKAIVVRSEQPPTSMVDALADAILAGQLLSDPLDLRPLPLSGIPGWCTDQDERFYRDAPCFRPLRPGRAYPAPWVMR